MDIKDNVKGRIFSYDFMRVIACIMVVIVHSPASITPCIYNNYYAIITYTMMPGVALFFMLSGALLLPTQLNPKLFFKKRFGKLIGPIIFWTLIYVIYQYFIEKIDFQHSILALLGMPFSNQGAPELWFLYTLLGLYIIIPILSPFIMKATQEDMEIYLFIWSLTLFIPLLRLIWDIPHSGIFTYVNGFVGFAFLGSYFHRFYYDSIFYRHSNILIISLFFLWAGSMITIKYFNLEGGAIMDVCSFPLVALTVAIFLVIKKINFKSFNNNSLIYAVIVNISTLSFGIYLSHSYLCKRFLHNWEWMMEQHILIVVIINAIISFFGAWLFSWLISKSRWSKYIIGV